MPLVEIMSEYDSGDDLFDGICTPTNEEQQPGKRKQSEDEYGDYDDALEEIASAKRPRLDSANSEDKSVSKVATAILAEKFGYESFRHEQEGAINAILRGDNALAIFPTGAGKSLCYQIPAIAFERLDLLDGSRGAGQHGITIVVSPLIALMKDQVDALKKRGIPADCMDSTKTWPEQQAISAAMRDGQLRILYCAPERLNNEGFVEIMKCVRGGVRLVAVDEAHCVSEWGHSFRPEYLKVARFVDEINAERVICLTATATPKVADDICKAFNISKSAVFRTSPYRPNLELEAMAVKSKQDKYPLIFDFLRKHPGPTLVYVTQQQQAVTMASDLKKQKFNASAFHAGMKVEQKTQVQDDFMANKVDIVVATIAFGMGIDKPDIRNVIHFDLPSTIEEYSQQVGRAGRDGKPSSCMYYMCPEDFPLRENFARGDLPSKSSLHSLLKDIFSDEVVKLREGEVFKMSHYEQSREFDIRQSPLNVIYATLELRFGLIRAITPEYSEYKFVASPTYYRLVHTDKSPEGAAIFKWAKKAQKWYKIDPTYIASSTGLRRMDIVRRLQQLHDQGALELKAGGVEPRYRVLKALPKTKKAIDELVDKVYKDLEKKEQDALRRMQEVVNLMTGKRCFASALAAYFGMDLPGDKQKCGHCTFCRTGKAVVLPPRPPEHVDIQKIKAVLQACDVRDDPRFLARVAFGIKSPRVTKLKLDKSPVFMSLSDHSFEALMREFTRACAGPK
ncbi:ATP-dependent DNA helicase [Coniochaeta ligniaria NRRL 30616]|uniref:ATP-dependent DNA helicase n=1 Tax=Coniochaeta ligniaria NRRL 30616 TaxID=1408157 RepID=A0A1J7JU57_9PEZI|nr:ATP-dependent DNA helicase [Coniochaeta ligniaria NRRL 30616]